MIRFAPPIVAIALAAPALALAGDRDVPPATPAGPAVDCISTINLRSQVRSDRVIDFTVAGRTYRNTLPQSCPSLDAERRFAYRLVTTRLCSIDIITVLQDPGLSAGPSCQLGAFQPIKRLQKRR